MLEWLEDNANDCDLWIDCHTDSSGIAADKNAYLHTVICSDSDTTRRISSAQDAITEAYIAKGYFERGAEKTQSAAWTETGGNYPKTLYGSFIKKLLELVDSCGTTIICFVDEELQENEYYSVFNVIK